jgi:nicotinamidase-related amidase
MLDPAEVQLFFADLQDFIMGLSHTNSPTAVRNSARTLATIGTILELPVVLSMVPGPDGPDVIGELTELLPDTPVHVRPPGPSGWDDPAARNAVIRHGRGVIVLCGVVTEIVVLHTALDAIADGYRVHIPIDACGGMTARGEDATLRRLEAAGAQITTVPSLAGDLIRDFTTPDGSAILAALHTPGSSIGASAGA